MKGKIWQTQVTSDENTLAYFLLTTPYIKISLLATELFNENYETVRKKGQYKDATVSSKKSTVNLNHKKQRWSKNKIKQKHYLHQHIFFNQHLWDDTGLLPTNTTQTASPCCVQSFYLQYTQIKTAHEYVTEMHKTHTQQWIHTMMS